MDPADFTKANVEADYVGAQMTQVEIADKYGVTQRLVHLRMRDWGIPSRPAARRPQYREYTCPQCGIVCTQRAMGTKRATCGSKPCVQAHKRYTYERLRMERRLPLRRLKGESKIPGPPLQYPCQCQGFDPARSMAPERERLADQELRAMADVRRGRRQLQG